MPRSFLVKSKRTHQLGTSKVFFRRQSQFNSESYQPVQQVMGQDKMYLEEAVLPLSPTVGVKDLLPVTCSPWDQRAAQPCSDPRDHHWHTGTHVCI